MNRTVIYTVVGLLAACLLPAPALGQFFNIDIDCEDGSPPFLGSGVPSSSFGAASGQTGVWNLLNGLSTAPIPLVGLNGAATGATVTVSSTVFLSCLSYNNPTNTGDYALLLNDASQAGTIVQGGSLTYTFNGIANGSYEVYTYASAPQGDLGQLTASSVFVPGSTSANPQFVSGPETGNAFALGITHSIHDILVTNNTLIVDVSELPVGTYPAYVAGFQIQSVPEPGTATMLGLGIAIAAFLRRRVIDA